MTMKKVDICIVGDGIVGKAMALSLCQMGVQTLLISADAKTPAPSNPDIFDARVYAINQASREFLTQLKIWPALDQTRITAVDKMQIYGDQQSSLVLDAYQGKQEALAWIVENNSILSTLEKALSFAPGFAQHNAHIESLEHTQNHLVVHLQNQTSIQCSLLIGADGAHSTVRTLAAIPSVFKEYQHTAIVAHIQCDKPHRNTAYQWFTHEQGIIALLPLPGPYVSLVWSLPKLQAQNLLQLALEDFNEKLSKALNPSPSFLGKLQVLTQPGLHHFPLRLLKTPSPIAHRVVLVGDAAHLVHPLAGQGLNLGLADLATLQQVLRLQQQKAADFGDLRILRRYARLRAEPVWLMQTVCDRLLQLFANPLTPVAWLRNQGIRILDRLPFAKNHLIRKAAGFLIKEP